MNPCTCTSLFDHFKIRDNIRIDGRRDGIIFYFSNIFFAKLLLNYFNQAGNFIRNKQMVVPRQKIITVDQSVFSREYAEMNALLLRASVKCLYPSVHVSPDCGEQTGIAKFVCRTVCTNGFQIFLSWSIHQFTGVRHRIGNDIHEHVTSLAYSAYPSRISGNIFPHNPDTDRERTAHRNVSARTIPPVPNILYRL